MRITVTYWNSEGDSEEAAVFNDPPEYFPYWLEGILSTGAFITNMEIR